MYVLQITRRFRLKLKTWCGGFNEINWL